MNMFAIGMQLKVFVGLFLLAVCIMFVPNIANYIMERMRDMIQTILGGCDVFSLEENGHRFACL